MKIIADTNIWYGLGQEIELYEKNKEKPIHPVFVNIHELSKTENLFDKEDLTRSAIRMLFKFKKYVIPEPPFVYLAQLNQEFSYDPQKEVGHWFNFTSKFAKGYSIEPSKKDEFKKQVEDMRKPLKEVSDFINQEANEIKDRIANKKAHKKIDTTQITAGFLNFCVEKTTNGKSNLDNFDLDKIELLVKTLDHFFKTLETSGMKFQANDWYDLAILSYVQPGDKFWTREKRWINLIKDAGCEDYLYTE